MREILFRGKRVDNGEWAEGYYCPTPFTGLPCKPAIYSADTINSDWCGIEVKLETVGQYTGLTDKNGKKIFEGDITVRFTNNVPDAIIPVWKSKVKFVRGVFKRLLPVRAKSYNTFDGKAESMSYEVIGNIYDNPELWFVMGGRRMTNLEVFNEIVETDLSAEDTALGMILSEFEQNLVRDFTLGLYMENNDNCCRYIERYHHIVKWLNEEKETEKNEKS